MFWSAQRRREQQALDRAELVSVLRGLDAPVERRGSAWRTGRAALFRWRRQLAPLVVIGGVWMSGWLVDVGGVPTVTVAAVALTASSVLWRLRYRTRLDRAPERLYAAVCLAASGSWLTAVAALGL